MWRVTLARQIAIGEPMTGRSDPTGEIAAEATSRKAREVAHPAIEMFQQSRIWPRPTNPRIALPVSLTSLGSRK